MEDTIIIEDLQAASQDAANALSALLLQLKKDVEPITKDSLSKLISSSSNYLLMIRDTEKNNIIGMITLIIYPTFSHGEKGYLEDLVVDENYRGQGLGRKLIRYAIKRAKELHAVSLTLTSQSSREAANQLYTSLGFEKRDTNIYKLSL